LERAHTPQTPPPSPPRTIAEPPVGQVEVVGLGAAGVAGGGTAHLTRPHRNMAAARPRSMAARPVLALRLPCAGWVLPILVYQIQAWNWVPPVASLVATPYCVMPTTPVNSGPRVKLGSRSWQAGQAGQASRPGVQSCSPRSPLPSLAHKAQHGWRFPHPVRIVTSPCRQG